MPLDPDSASEDREPCAHCGGTGYADGNLTDEGDAVGAVKASAAEGPVDPESVEKYPALTKALLRGRGR